MSGVEGVGETFGVLLRRYRVEASMSQESLAEKAAVSANAVAALEQGRRRSPRLSTVRKLADALDLDPARQAVLAQAAAGGVVDEGLGRSWSGPAGRPVSLPLPTAVSRQHRSAFVGRRMELGRLVDAWRARDRFSLVLGEAGVGKSRLVSEAARSLHAGGATVLWGRCSEARLGRYAPVVEALRDLLAAVPAAAMADLPARCGELARLLPDLANRVPTLAGPTQADAGTEQRLLFEAVVAVLQRCEPALVVIDDLHWADVGTLDLVSYLATAGDLDDVVIVGTARPVDLRPEVSGRLAELARHVDTARMHLDGLPAPDVRELVGRVCNAALSEELVDEVTRAAEGNPLFVEELTAHLVDTGAAKRVVDGEAADMLRAEIPQRVRDMVGHRVAKLASPTSAMVRAGAVFGREFNVALAAEAAGLAGDAVVPAADEALGCGVVVESDRGTLAFTHSLIHNAVVGQLSRLARADLHRRAALILEGRVGSAPDAASEISRHWDDVAEVDPAAQTTAAVWAVRAGDAALAAAAAEEAIARYDDACRWWAASTAGHCDALIRSGHALRHCGRMAEADERFRQALHLATALDDPELRGRAAVGFGMMFRFGTSDPERVAAVDGARQCLDPADRRWRPLLTGLLASHMIFDTDPAAVARRQALASEVTTTVEDPATPSDVLVDLARCRLFLSIAEPARLDRVMRRIAGPAEARRDLTALFEVWFALAWAALEQGDMQRLDEAVGEMAAVSERDHSPHSGAFVALIRGAMAIIAGRYEEAEKLGLRARELFELSGNPNATRLYGSQVMVRAFDDGRAGDVLPFLRNAAAEVNLPPLAATAALAAALAGQAEEAREILDRLATVDFRPVSESVERGSSLAFLAHAAAVVGAVEHAPRLYGLLAAHPVPVIRVAAVAAWWGPTEHHLGVLARLLGRLDAAEQHLSRALRLEQTMGAAPFAARTSVELVRVGALGDPGGRASGRRVAQAVLAEADRSGWAGIAREAHTVVDALA